ncbi:hypothetical protein LTR78_000215 [Recurvomyces mirabilis]|uniref:Membrane insertase YidC/Oxa/ALB C-terminal domain-containing protein n=1 Tax=Recurvomyces mirabilis TaxID=574656 RepID=A0AAE0WXM2_9PEZI|nr:hypothetical protein LTR78_000215 [Recurvomyces mirabilis]KAK5161871.1 hypothetical protein LTS14_000216 [Recurvomyces mirabilis]
MPATPPPTTEALPTKDVTSITLDDLDLSALPDLSTIPVKIGYLHEIGLSYWYGPTSMLEWLMEHIHVYSGLPWWGSIACTALVIRLAIFPFFLKSSDSMARSNALVSVTKPITERMQAAQKTGNTQGVMEAWQEMQTIRSRAGISFRAQFAPIIMQGVLGFCGFKLLRAMVALPVPGFMDGGFLWLTDLTLPDPYGILPLVMGAAIHLLIRIGGESGAAAPGAIPPAMQSFMWYGMPGIVILIMAWQPGALCVWFTVSGALGMVQGLMLQRPAVRKYFGIAPLYKPTKSEGPVKNEAYALFESMLPKPKASSAATAAAAEAVRNNAAYIRTSYQAPNLHTNNYNNTKGPLGSTNNVIDVVAKNSRSTPSNSTSSADAQEKSGGIMGSYNGMRDGVKNMRNFVRETTTAQAEKNKARAKKEAAAAYERRAGQRQGGKGGR